MARSLDRHTLADLMVNLFPVVIVALFAAMFVLYNPWGRFGLASLLQFGLLLVMVTVLVYVSGKAGLAVARTEDAE